MQNFKNITRICAFKFTKRYDVDSFYIYKTVLERKNFSMNHSNNCGLFCYCSSLKTENAVIVFMVSITKRRDRNSVPHFNNGKTLRNSFCSLQKFYEKKDKWNKNIYELV